MDQKSFDWFEDTVEVDITDISVTTRGPPLSKRAYDIFVLFSTYILIASTIVFLFIHVFTSYEYAIGGISLTFILGGTIISNFTLIVVTRAMHGLITLVSRFGDAGTESRCVSVYPYVSLALWYTFDLILLNKFVAPTTAYLIYLEKYLKCGILFSGSYSVVTLVLEYFNEYFIEKNLCKKMIDVDVRERILAAMKSFRYEISSSSSVDTQTEHRNSIFSWILGNESGDEGNEDEYVCLRNKDARRIGNLYFREPEIRNLSDAKMLSRDVFEKAAEGDDRLGFTKFSRIFPNTQIAIQAYQFFDTDEDKKIGKKEFREGIIQFFVERINLEKSFKILKGFVNIIEDIIRIVIFFVILLICLIIFGIPLKELTALALSSALILNFMASGVASGVYSNFMMIMSHPYDIGDDVIVEGKDLKVHKIGLTSTSFIVKNGGKVKLLNSDLWRQKIINMTRAPEKILIFQFGLSKNLSIAAYTKLKEKIHKYLRTRPYDFHEVFSLESKSEECIDINFIRCLLILKCKSYKSKGKKFILRVEVTKMLRDVIGDLKIYEQQDI